MPDYSDDYLKRCRWKNPDRFVIEGHMVKGGGKYQGFGNGKYYHTKALITALWPHFKWHRWSELLIRSFCENKEIGIMGPASSGKTYCAAAFALATFFVWPEGTSIVISSTTRDGLQLRVWGAIKELWNKARTLRPNLPGRILESRMMITGADDDSGDAQDFRDGIIGVPCKVGGQFVGLSNYVGLKNARVILIADEASLMASGFLDSTANLQKNDDFKMIAMGNPKDRTDCLGKICEPSPAFGGWEGLPYEEKTRTWPTRRAGGISVQICGYDSPNYDFPRGLNPYKGLITPEQIDNDLAYYGRDSMQFSMMNLGVMPKDGGSRRVITFTLCDQNHAFDDIIWDDISKITRIVGVDAAYSGIGGDRCVMTELAFGPDRTGQILMSVENQSIIPITANAHAQIAEDQIAQHVRSYCIAKGIPPENNGFDATGRGTLGTAFARLWSASVIPIEFGGKPLNRPTHAGAKEDETELNKYGKMVTALWYASRLIIESKQMRKLPRDCAEEGSMREWGLNANGKIDVETKDKTKERMGRSPDLWDSLVVAIEVARRRGFPIASSLGVGIVKRTQPAWMLEMAEDARKLQDAHSLVYT